MERLEKNLTYLNVVVFLKRWLKKSGTDKICIK